jgi:hypothetical protein
MARRPEKPKEDKALHIFVPDSWHDWLREQAFKRRTSIAEIIRQAMEEALPDLPNRPPPDEGRKGGVIYAVNPHTASTCADH